MGYCVSVSQLQSAQSFGSEELSEFADAIANCKPVSAARWLLDYFHGVRCIYAFQVLSGADHENGWEILESVVSSAFYISSDNEGFSMKRVTISAAIFLLLHV